VLRRNSRGASRFVEQFRVKDEIQFKRSNTDNSKPEVNQT
jgi:hypothetical protein